MSSNVDRLWICIQTTEQTNKKLKQCTNEEMAGEEMSGRKNWKNEKGVSQVTIVCIHVGVHVCISVCACVHKCVYAQAHVSLCVSKQIYADYSHAIPPPEPRHDYSWSHRSSKS